MREVLVLMLLLLSLAPQSSHASDMGSSSVVISELLWMGSDVSTADEWVEIANTGGQRQTIGGYVLTIMKATGETAIATFPSSLTIDPGQYLVISNYERAQSRLDVDPAFTSLSMTLPNTKLLLRLRDSEGNLVDEVDDYIGDPFAGSNSTGLPKASMERVDLSGSGGLKSNWRTAGVSLGFDSGIVIFGSPGFPNNQSFSSSEPVLSTVEGSSYSSYSSIASEPSSSTQSQSTNNTQQSFSSSSSFSSYLSSYSGVTLSSVILSSVILSSVILSPSKDEGCPLASGSTLNPTIVVQSGRLSGSEPVTVNLQAVASSGSLAGITCHWDYGDGFTSDSCNPPSHTMRAKGSYFIHLFAHDQCVNTVERTMQVNVLEKGGSSYFTQDNSPIASCMPSAFSGVVIRELLPNPATDEGAGEWIELYNPLDVSLPLCGWFLDDTFGGSKPYSLSRYQLPAKEHLLIDRNESGIALNNSEDSVRLIGPKAGVGTGVMMEVQYQDAPRGESYALRTDGNWLWTDHLTPGKQNAFEDLSAVLAPTIIIRAAYPNPRGKDKDGEWIELDNLLPDRPQWLNGWTLANLDGKAVSLNGIVLKKKERKHIFAEDLGMSLKNSSEGLILRDHDDEIVSLLTWDNANEGQIVSSLQTSERSQATVTNVIDGNTVEVALVSSRAETREDKRTIRLLGIDTPELYEDGGDISDIGVKAKNYLEALIENKKVELEFDTDKQDKYGRTLAYVFDERGKDVQRELLLKGLAYAYRSFPVRRLGPYKVFESLARELKLGIWSSVATSDYYLTKQKEQEKWAQAQAEGLQVSIDQKSGLVGSGTVVHFKTSIPWAKLYVSLNGSSFSAFTGSLIVDRDVKISAYAQVTSETQSGSLHSKQEERSFILKRDNYPRSIVLSEIYASPNKGEQEWVELWNPSDQTIDLSGWKINKFFVPIGTSIAAGGRVIFEKNLTHLVLRNTGDTVHLLDPNGAIAASVTYPKLKNGQSYSVRDGTYCVTDDPTPGEENVCVIHTKARKKSPAKDSPGIKDARNLLASLEGQVVEKADAFSPHREPSNQKTIAEAILLSICFAWAMFVLWVLLKK